MILLSDPNIFIFSTFLFLLCVCHLVLQHINPLLVCLCNNTSSGLWASLSVSPELEVPQCVGLAIFYHKIGFVAPDIFCRFHLVVLAYAVVDCCCYVAIRTSFLSSWVMRVTAPPFSLHILHFRSFVVGVIIIILHAALCQGGFIWLLRVRRHCWT